MKQLNWKNITLTALVAALATGLTGCGAIITQPQANLETLPTVAGTILLAVNPEIEIDYDDKGLVLEIEGINKDGKTIVADYDNYQGKPSQIVVSELVRRIFEAGYFETTIEGNVKNIIVKLERGSAYPSYDFLEKIYEGVRQALDDSGVESEPILIDDDDLDETGLIGLEKAKELILAQLGLDEAIFTEREYELDDDVYELEFTVNGVEYEFEINALTGKIMEADYENNDDWDDDQDDDMDDMHDDEDMDGMHDDDDMDDMDDDDDMDGMDDEDDMDGMDDDDDRDGMDDMHDDDGHDDGKHDNDKNDDDDDD